MKNIKRDVLNITWGQALGRLENKVNRSDFIQSFLKIANSILRQVENEILNLVLQKLQEDLN